MLRRERRDRFKVSKAQRRRLLVGRDRQRTQRRIEQRRQVPPQVLHPPKPRRNQREQRLFQRLRATLLRADGVDRILRRIVRETRDDRFLRWKVVEQRPARDLRGPRNVSRRRPLIPPLPKQPPRSIQYLPSRGRLRFSCDSHRCFLLI